MKTKKTDLRIIRTHHNIRQAFIKLLQTRSFADIVVKDILDTAIVNRATFYKYYSGKDDLVAQMIADYKAFYQENMTELMTSDDLYAFIARSSQTLFEKRELVLALWKIETKRHHLYQDMKQILRDIFLQHYARNDKWRDYQAELFATMVLTTERYFFERGDEIPATEIIGQWEKLVALVKVGK